MMDARGDRESREEEPFQQQVEDDPTEAVEEAEPYFPPTDPVVVEGPVDGDLAERVRLALARDAATTDLAPEVVEENDGVVTLRGTVQSLEDTDNAIEVAARVPGVKDVVDELAVEEDARR